MSSHIGSGQITNDVGTGQSLRPKLIVPAAVEQSAQYAAHVERLEARLRVVEQIVTDGGIQTAAQIEALRDNPLAAPSRQGERERLG